MPCGDVMPCCDVAHAGHLAACCHVVVGGAGERLSASAVAQRQVLVALRVAQVSSLHLQHDEPVEEKSDDQRVLAGEEHVRVAEDEVFEDEDQAKHEERRVLHDDRDDDAVHVWRTASVGGGRQVVDATRHHARVVLTSLRRRQHHRELEEAPRPDGQHRLAQHRVVTHLQHKTRHHTEVQVHYDLH